jgi:hypothetical protein
VAHGEAFTVRECCASTTPVAGTSHIKKFIQSVEVVDEHDVAVFFVELRKEYVAAVG